MITTDLSTTKDDLILIGELVNTFFKSADRNNDNVISEAEFVEGVKEMPVILHLLQCDPDADDLNESETIDKFDSLQVSEKQLSSNKGGNEKATSDTVSQRSSAYKSQ